MTNKKLELKRLLLFLLISFGLAWITEIICINAFGYDNWFSGPFAIIGGALVGFAPLLGNVLTRKITKEGWHDSLFHLNFKGNIKYYILAVLIVIMRDIINCISFTLIYGHWDFKEMIDRIDSFPSFLSNALIIIAVGPLFAWNTFGEEFGWRAYMNQKMESLIGTAGTVIVGGILWGVWHAPLTVYGHNFGTDYPGYPWLGILNMAIFCTAEGAFLMWLTKKTNSVFPAAVMHACNNMGVGNAVGSFFISGVDSFEVTPLQSLVSQIPFFICAAVITIIMINTNKTVEKKGTAKS